MKRLALYFSFVVVLCFFNLVASKAQLSVNQTKLVNTQLVVNQGGYDKVSAAEDKMQQKKDEIEEAIEQAKTSYWTACTLAVSTCLSTILCVTTAL